MRPINIEKIYLNYLVKKNETKLKEIREQMPETNQYSASSAGMCSRKIYYKAIEKATKTEEINNKTKKIFRIGELIHEDIQDSMQEIIKRKEPKENI